MLVLTRKSQESVVIDGGIEIFVIGIAGNKVKLGFNAPPGVRVRRSEIVQRQDVSQFNHDAAIEGGAVQQKDPTESIELMNECGINTAQDRA